MDLTNSAKNRRKISLIDLSFRPKHWGVWLVGWIEICLQNHPYKAWFLWNVNLQIATVCMLAPFLPCLTLQCKATLSNLLFLTQRKPDSAWWSMHQRSKETKLARRRLIQGRTFSDFQFLAKKFYTETPIRLSNCKIVGRSIIFGGK